MTHPAPQNATPHPALQIAFHHLRALQPDQFEIYFEHQTSTQIDSKNQNIDTLSRSEDVGLAIRLVKNHKLGFSYTTSLEENTIRKSIETAFEIAKHMPEDPYVNLHSFENSVYPHVDTFDTKSIALPFAEKIQLAKHLEAVCKKADSRITAVRHATVSETIHEIQLMDSHGDVIHFQSTGYAAQITCKAEHAGDSQMGGDFQFSNDLDTLSLDSVGENAARWATELLGAKPAPTLHCPAIFRNSVVAEFIDFLSASFSAENLDKGRSMLAGKMGEVPFSDEVTLIDDGLLSGGMGTTPFDGEGIPSKKTILVDRGQISNMLYDLYYSRKKGIDPTGSTSRTLKSPPSIHFSNFYLQRGRTTVEALLDGISRGILITDLMGIHTANPITGDFSLGASGILIENGKLGTPVRGFAVAGNILEVFKRITDVGNDLRFFGKVGAPSIRLSEISIGGI